MYICILDGEGKTVLHKNRKATPEAFLRAIAPYREDVVVAVECMFVWYWLADVCAKEKFPFILGHALYMKAVHGGNSKNDRIDSHKIAALLRGGTFSVAYVYPRKMRSTRDLLRRRNYLVRKRSEFPRPQDRPGCLLHAQTKGTLQHGYLVLPRPQTRLITGAGTAMTPPS